MATNEPITVVLADDHPFVRAGIRATLAAEQDVVLVGRQPMERRRAAFAPS